ncbi:hypothetical protein ASPWEDRAFT_53850 [Aspergillus wentii DTO 134E9]|uniref:Origin recognition complex subunit 4 n=1 Tax=Aspergillus wentii DTO 134E9 TaxID=1073089 RepID=A0A1L9RB58_ASPWE|nr:uncharacterized protein ASPWEDRAFT_53850 [Aspergillus wentii DTO 134E9]KAI9934736.1 origin recognition complex subunit 4 [Aspergillus wentii]OJJ32162.1 hypothetical protein ASPWEDRAFT_53850 [Aspergillus wentii DTO 134E9]
MKDPRAAKRRKVDEDGDVTMGDNDQDIYSVPSSPTRQDKNGHQEDTSAVEESEDREKSPTPTPKAKAASRRRTSRASQKDEHADDKGDNNAAETPSRVGVRSSGRQRKPPQRFEDESTGTPSRRRVDAPDTATSARKSRTPRSTRKARQVSETEDGNGDGGDDDEEEVQEEDDDEDEEETPPPPRSALARTRSKRANVRFSTADTGSNKRSTRGQEASKQSPTPDDDQDGFDDLVSMQLQQDLVHQDLDAKDNDTVPADPLPDYAEQFQALSQKGLLNELNSLTKIVLEKLNGKRLTPLKGLESEYHKVHQLVEQTVTAGEGNSMLLLGSRGSGKTAILETIISSLRKEHNDEFHVVQLNGFLHTDDRLALREMWRQLGREMNTEDEVGKVNSYADTMATLLTLLSHPDELSGSSNNHNAMTAAKSIVIVLDEFDLFVSHPRQTLLYNLFDIAQARKAPIAVIGVTTKVDVTEMLEKRVKSRFSHRYVFVPLPRTFDVFSEICFAGLNLDEEESSELNALAKSSSWPTLVEAWRDYLQSLWNDEAFQTHLQRIYHTTKSVKEFFTSSLLAITDLHYSTYPTDSTTTTPLQVPTPKSFTSTANSLTCPDPAPLPFSIATTASSSPSSLPLSLLLAATRLTALYDPGPDSASQPQSLAPLALSFPAAYAEYVRLLTSAKVSASVSGAAATPGRVWGRDVAREAWEKLVGWGLVSPVGGGTGTADGRMFRVEISFEEVVEMAGSGGSLGRWWRDG